ncbi:hypothetical protein HLI01_08685 [Rhizobium laguerreae]|uniref:hypothetical protein n=1 Tax=Rhizobium laguerreae TaxID=1076926 RepID=UPI00147840B0|nr:hypothetical protein [Rhizobium laguerreae]NNH56883.1 hypothetical protein [Rhizobium laguerreae]
MKDKSIGSLILRKIIGKLANLTPGVVYYPSGWPTNINDVLRKIGQSKDGQSLFATAAVSMSCALHEHLPAIGDRAEIRLSGVTRGSNEVGDFLVSVTRI